MPQYNRYGKRPAPRSHPRHGWLTLAAIALCVVGLIIVLTSLGSLVTGMMNRRPQSPEKDPMFAEEAETVTRPPSLAEESDGTMAADEDPSQNWIYETLTPLTPDGYAAS